MFTLCHNYFSVNDNDKNNQDAAEPFSKRKYFFGVFLLILVSVLWVVSSELTKYIYTEQKLDRPFLVTYVRSSLLFIYLIVLCFTPPTRDPCRPGDYTQLLEPTAEADDDNYFTDATNSLVSIGDSTFVPVRAGETTDSDDAAPRAVRFNKVAEVRVMSAAQAGEALLARLSWAASVRASEHAQRRAAAAATRRHLRLALVFCIPWFVTNYLYRLSLLHAAAGAATVYTSAAGAFAQLLGAVFAHSPADRCNASKCVAALITASSLVLLLISEGAESSWAGAGPALGAALCYAAHLLLLRRELRDGDGINSPLFVGLVGCACGCLTWLLGGALALGDVERAPLPPPRLWLWLLADAAFGPIVLETLWLWGLSLTASPETASCIVGFVFPMSTWVDTYRGAGWTRLAAGLLACCGWAAAVLQLPCSPRDWLNTRIRAAEGFTAVRTIPELDEQTEALMSSDEPT